MKEQLKIDEEKKDLIFKKLRQLVFLKIAKPQHPNLNEVLEEIVEFSITMLEKTYESFLKNKDTKINNIDDFVEFVNKILESSNYPFKLVSSSEKETRVVPISAAHIIDQPSMKNLSK